MLRVTIEHDTDVENPLTDCDGMWTHYSFNNRHRGYSDPDNFTENDEITSKLESGLAFWCDYHEHGLCKWDVHGNSSPDMWDTAQFGGIIVWENAEDDMGAKTVEDRRKDAQACLDVYTEWCNGHCYWYSIERISNCEHCGHEIEEDLDSCGGFVGDDHVFDAIKEALTDYPDEEVEFAGEAAWLAQYHDVR